VVDPGLTELRYDLDDLAALQRIRTPGATMQAGFIPAREPVNTGTAMPPSAQLSQLVKVGDGRSLPAIQAILRGQIALAAKGNGPAQRAVIEKIQAIEQELALEAAAEAAETKATEKPIPDRELARRIAWILSGAVPKRSPGGGAEGNETGPGGKSGKE
jgi:hypothetical protein